MTHGSLFSGIGGFDLAAEWMGWENVFHCEWNPFGRKVLNHYWPKAESFEDITKSDFTKYNGTIDIISGGFPCQPYSAAGKRLGKEDDRHLWPEMLRAVREVQPRWVVGENVRGLTNWNGGVVFDEVQADLETQGYEVLPFLLPACSVNAPHRRDRIWFIANAGSAGTWSGSSRRNEPWKLFQTIQRKKNKQFDQFVSESWFIANPSQPDEQWDRLSREQQEVQAGRCNSRSSWENFPTQSPIRNGNDGVPAELDGITFSKWRNESIKAGGNAIVPQVAFQIFKAIEQINTDA